MDQRTHDIAEVRSQICNVFLVTLAIVTVPTTAASLYRITWTGWLPYYAVHLGLALGLCLFALFRSRVPYNIRAGFIVTVFVTVGLLSFWQYGVLGSGWAFAAMAPAISAIFFGTRVAVLVFVGSLLTGVAIGLHSLSVSKLPAIDPIVYALQPSSWVVAILAWVFVGASVLAAIVMYNRGLFDALLAANRNEDALRKSERRFRDFADAALDVFWETDTDHRLSFVSASDEFLPTHFQKQAIGRTRWELAAVDPSQDETWTQHRETMLAHKPFRLAVPNRQVSASGQTRTSQGQSH